MGNTDRLLAFLPAAAVLLLPHWGYNVCPGKKDLLHLCASWLSPHAAHLDCDDTNLPNKHLDMFSEWYVRLRQPADQRYKRRYDTFGKFYREYSLLLCMGITYMSFCQFQTHILFIITHLTAPNFREY